MADLATYTVPDEVYASFFYRATGTITRGRKAPSIPLQSYQPTGYFSTGPAVPPISTTVYFPTHVAVASTAKAFDTPSLDQDSISLFRDIDITQTTDTSLSPEAQNFPVFTTLTPQASYISTAVAQNLNESPISPAAIIGLATGGAISILVALAMTIFMCTRRRQSGRYRQNSVAGPGMPVGMMASACGTELSCSKEQVHELPSSLKPSTSNSGTSSNRSRYSKHITWKDQVFSDQSFMTLPPLPPHPASMSLPSLSRNYFRVGEGAQEPDSSNLAIYFPPRPDNRISYRSFSSPTLGADCTSIYSSVPPSPVCVSALSPIPSYLFPASYQFHRSPISSCQYNPTVSNPDELNDHFTTITCTGIYSFISGPRRSPSDSFIIQETNSSNPARKSSIHSSGSVQTPSHSSYPNFPVPFPKTVSCASRMQACRNRCSTFAIIKDTNDDSDSISSVSSTSSSILNFSVGGIPRKLLAGLLTVDSSPLSSERTFDDSPPSGGLTSPSHRKRYPGRELKLQASSFSSHALDSRNSPQVLSSGIGVAMSPPFFGAAFTSSPASERVFEDDISDIDTYSPTLEEISTRHFSCSMSTRPRSMNTDCLSSPHLEVVHPSLAYTTTVPQFCGRDSPTLPLTIDDPSIELQGSDHNTPEISPAISHHMYSRVESTYSPTLSMLNFYTIGGHTDELSSANLFASLSADSPLNPRHARSSSVPIPMSPIINYKNQSQARNRKLESFIKECPPNSPEERLRPLSLTLGAMKRIGMMDIPGTHERVIREVGSYVSQSPLVSRGYPVTGKRVDEKEDDRR